MDMKFYFCESCGKRVTGADLEKGLARNKQIKGVYCNVCAVGVKTLEMPPLSEEAAYRALAKGTTPPEKTQESARALPTSKPAATGARTHEHRAKAQPFPVLPLFAGMLVLFAVAAAVALNQKPAQQAAVAPKPAPPAPEKSQPNLPPAVAPGKAAKEEAVLPHGEDPPQAPAVAPAVLPKSEENMAQDALTEVLRFTGLATDDSAGRVASLEALAARYPDTLAASRARTMANGYKKGAVPQAASKPPEVRPAEDPPAVPKPPEGKSAETAPPVPKPPEISGAGTVAFKEDFEGETIPGLMFAEIAAQPPAGAHGKAMNLLPNPKRSNEIRGALGCYILPRGSPQRDKGIFFTLPDKAMLRFRYFTENVSEFKIIVATKGDAVLYQKRVETVADGKWTSIEVPLAEFQSKGGVALPPGSTACAEIDFIAYGKGGHKAYLDEIEIVVPRP